jgi:hypothetical protein
MDLSDTFPEGASCQRTPLWDQGFIPLADGPASYHAVSDERVRLDELLGSIARREDAHRAACGGVGKRTDHEKLPRPVRLPPESAMRFEVKRNLGSEIVGGFVEQDVLHGQAGYHHRAVLTF